MIMMLGYSPMHLLIAVILHKTEIGDGVNVSREK